MFNPQECIAIYCKHLNKKYGELNIEEKAILTDVIDDNIIGRYPKALMWTVEKHTQFIRSLKESGIDYHDLSRADRWAYEDAYDMN